jgi:DNA-directed RNA polymerase sigma subunit (sigma70/sigma32)
MTGADMASDRELWEDWKNASAIAKPRAFQALMTALDGPVMSAVQTYRAAPVPTLTLELEGRRIAGDAVKEWSPSAGSSLASYIGTMVRQRLNRWVLEHANVARLPEAQQLKLNRIQAAENALAQRLQRDPTVDELADHLHVPTHRLESLRKLRRPDLIAGNVDAATAETFEDISHDRDYERAMLGYYQLTDQEKKVFDWSTGLHGSPQKSPGDMAAALGVGNSRISAIKESIAHKLRPFLGA